MSYSSQLTKTRILNFAKEEFLSKDFSNANLRTIAKNANVTTGALYNHFNNKEMLFEKLVEEFANNLLDLFYVVHNNVPKNIEFSKNESKEIMEDGNFKILNFIYNNLDEAKLIFFHSKGSKYENYKDKLIEIEEISSIAVLENQNYVLNNVDRFFVHVMSTSGVNNMLEAIHHNLSKDDAFSYMKKIQKFYYAGTKEILGG